MKNKNRSKIGKAFEKKAFVYLKKKFKKVEWLSSKNWSSNYDFACYDDDGVKYLIDARSGVGGLTLRSNGTKNKTDFIVSQKNGKIYLFNPRFVRGLRVQNVAIAIDDLEYIKKLQIHPNQPYWEIIKEVFKHYKEKHKNDK